MRNVAVCGAGVASLSPPSGSTTDPLIVTVPIEEIPVYCGLLHTPEPKFNPDAPEHCDRVLVKIRAFSCNYRDKSLILKMATRGSLGSFLGSFYVVGSEFVGEVVAVGSAVTCLAVGDRVIADNHYPEVKVEGIAPGIPNNHSSREYQILHPVKLMRIPDEMPDDIAAAFSIGAQTSYSMVRKLNLTDGDRVLVTAARSNTSLFVIQALQQYNVEVYATTTSPQFVSKLEQLGIKAVIPIDPTAPNFKDNPTIDAIVQKTGGFNAVVDPFFDLHLGRVVDVMAFGARYITCGLYDQYSQFTGKAFDYRGHAMSTIMTMVMLKNISLIGNCIGHTDDLKNALQDYLTGKLKLTLDSVFGDREVGEFFDRTYNVSDRLGKVVYCYV